MDVIKITLAFLLLLIVPMQILAEPPPPDRTVWERVDIVPMPKRIRLTGRHLSLEKGVIILGKNPSEQDRIGAKWINDHIIKKGGKVLPVVTDDRLTGDETLKIYVGTRNTNAVIDEAVRQKLFKLGPENPGKQGYIIQPRNKGAVIDIFLGGADPIGALYACVTLAGLLEKKADTIVLRETEIIDWPDYPIVTHGWNLANPELQNLGNKVRWAGDNCPNKLREEYLLRVKKYLDQLLGWKISCFKVADVRKWRNLSTKFMATYHEITDYAKARGVHSLYYAFRPFVGFRDELPEAPELCLTGTGRERYKGYVRCWSMDEERRKNARRIAKFAKAAGITDLGFHDTDEGGYLNPARWNNRCEVCRKRWGDDYAAATLNKHRIYYDEIKKIYPDCRIHFTLYPYNISLLTEKTAEQHNAHRYGPSSSVPEVVRQLRERFTDFWTRQARVLPPDVTFCIRENIPINVILFQELTDPHGTFIWYLVGSKQWRTFFDRSPSWAPTFYSDRNDLMFAVSMESFIPLKALAVREYAWNINTPGVEPWNKLPDEEWWKSAEAKGEIYTIVLPHIVRNLFGCRAAPELTKVLSFNMAMNHIFDYEPTIKRLTPMLKAYDKWNWQAEQAEKGCDILDKLFERFVESGDKLGMTDYAARRFIYIREVFHCSKWMARAKAENMHALELAKARKLEEASVAIRLGLETVVKARIDMKQLLEERPEDPIYNFKTKPNKPQPHWQVYTPGNHVDYDIVEKLLESTKKELTSFAAAGDLPARALKSLAR
jgi:glycosyl hydrolase family 20